VAEPILEPTLDAALKRRRVAVCADDPDTLLLRNVPTNRRCFNKTSTNVLLKRLRPGTPLVVCVDEDLEYVGADASLLRAFAAGTRQSGWRAILVDARDRDDLSRVVERALAAVGFDGAEPAIESIPDREADGRATLLDRFAIDVGTAGARPGSVSTIGREAVVLDLVATLFERDARLPIVVGGVGVGKTHVLAAVATEFRRRTPAGWVVSVDLGDVFAGTLFEGERENLLRAIIEEAAEAGAVLAIERFELALTETGHAPFVLARRALALGRHVIGTILPAHLPRVLECAPLARYVYPIVLPPLTESETRRVLEGAAAAVAAHHGIRIDAALLAPVVQRAATLAGVLPATALSLLDAAAARAYVEGAGALDLAHVFDAASRFQEARE
jgi:ATP-dependent Clp protease ATP-binding subunit ClpA